MPVEDAMQRKTDNAKSDSAETTEVSTPADGAINCETGNSSRNTDRTGATVSAPAADVETPETDISSTNPNRTSMVSASSEAEAEFAAWMARYKPVEREIIEAHERRIENRVQRAVARRSAAARAFGDLCEATEGFAVVWRREGWSVPDMVRWADGDVFTLMTLAKWLRKDATRFIDRVQSRLRRPLYYAREKARREALAAERRRIGGRRTSNPCPTREAILDAWIHRRESHETAVRFGSMIHDLECYVDNSLLRNSAGAITGRRGGVKEWLRENIPALHIRYTTVMRYKAMAKKLMQVTGLSDPIPAAAVLSEPAENKKIAGGCPEAECTENGSKAAGCARDKGETEEFIKDGNKSEMSAGDVCKKCGREENEGKTSQRNRFTECRYKDDEFKAVDESKAGECKGDEKRDYRAYEIAEKGGAKIGTKEIVTKSCIAKTEKNGSEAVLQTKDGFVTAPEEEKSVQERVALPAKDIIQRHMAPQAGKPAQEHTMKRPEETVPDLAVVRAKAVWMEVIDGVRGSATALMERLDALTDPGRVEDAAMLAEWKAKYDNEITERMKSKWWKRLSTKRSVG